MIKKSFFISIGVMVFSVLYMAVVMAFPISAARFTARHEYKLSLALIEYFDEGEAQIEHKDIPENENNDLPYIPSGSSRSSN